MLKKREENCRHPRRKLPEIVKETKCKIPMRNLILYAAMMKKMMMKMKIVQKDTSSYLYSNPNADCDDHTIIMNLLDVAVRSEQTEDNILLDKEDEEEISQDAALKLLPATNLPHNTIDIIDNLIFRVTCLVKKSLDL
ncbi:hypothetical protein EVAR_101384_1, partial [Eumeta japonica]